jgi:hypothetical protein
MYEVDTADELSPVQTEGALPIDSLTDLRNLAD